MDRRPIRRALISVFDKTGIVEFAGALVDEFGIEIISTGGTATLLKNAGIPVRLVEEITGFPEMLDGRVKTLHPKIFAAILADRDDPQHMQQLADQGIEPIDLVVVNLYPFEKTVAEPECTFEQAIEMIDIGGPSLLRAAAKNHKGVLPLPITLPRRYESVLEGLRKDNGHSSAAERLTGAEAVFQLTGAYDASIGGHLRSNAPVRAPCELVGPPGAHLLTYGENPHMQATFRISAPIKSKRGPRRDSREASLGPDAQVAGPTMSFNNFLDAGAAMELCKELARAYGHGRRVCLFVKHTNPCGVGVATEAVEAYRRAYIGDVNAAMGGILACSFAVTTEFAAAVTRTYDRWGKEAGGGGFFVEVWLAPAFDADSVAIIENGKAWGRRVRLLKIGDLFAAPSGDVLDHRSITGGMLTQTRDLIGLNEGQWSVVTKRKPNEREMSDLRLAWLVCKHTKSNAISICKDSMLIGNGAGQMSRVMSCRIATWLANENGHAARLAGSSAASDGFFPFADGPTILMDAGVTALIQPGGSKRDAETIAAVDARGAAMIFTGTRHFKH